MTGTLNMEVIDELLELSEDGDPELLIDLIQMFLDDAPVKLQAILRGVESGDWEQVERAAHSLKGSSGNLGATQVQNACDTIQNACRAGRTTDAVQTVQGLPEHFEAAETALRELISKLR